MGAFRIIWRAGLLAALIGAAQTLAAPALAEARTRKSAQDPMAEPALLPARAKGPVTLVVSTDAQRLSVYDGDELIGATSVSTGVADHPTPHGVFSIIDKKRYHESNIYSTAPMPYMQRLTWSGIALHEGRVTGAPASHGCIRLPADFARALFSFTREGARVIIAHEDVAPAPLYGGPTFLAPPKSASAPDGAVASLPGEIELVAATRLMRPPTCEDVAVRAPVSVLVHRKLGKIFVRRAFKPLFEAPIEIDARERSIGLHVLVAQARAADALSWQAVNIAGRSRLADARGFSDSSLGVANIMADDGPAPKRRRARTQDNQNIIASMGPVAGLEPSTQEALRRLHLAPGVAARIAALIGAGATLIVSDEGARGRETWNGTNFIALSE